MTPIIYPYKIGSAGARALATALNTRCVRPNGAYRPRNGHVIINWGSSEQPAWLATYARVRDVWLNSLTSVRQAANKLSTFEAFRNDVPRPDWTTDRNVARGWFDHEGAKVVCRTLLNASEGRGIVIARNADELVNAPLYVKFFAKRDEFRFHIFNGEIIDVAQKRLRNGARDNPNRNPYVRNTANGWIFAHNDVHYPDAAREAALQAVRALGLSFGAVDLAVNDRGTVKVFEVNTAPGIEGQTIQRYADAIRRYCNA